MPNEIAPKGPNETTATLSNDAWAQRYGKSLLGVFGKPQRILVRGEGAYVWDADGNRYLDLLAGIAVNALGHAHPFLSSAVATQLATLGHISNFFSSPTTIALAERLLSLTEAPDGSRVFFTNSGTEAIEAAFKLTRKTGRTKILALEGAFHGRTMGALALTHKSAYRTPFEPLPGHVEHIPFGDFAALERAMSGEVAAVFLEPIQGEAGVRTLPDGYLSAARELTSRYQSLLVVDEVQTGIGRTGYWLGLQNPAIGEGVVPDVVTLAKGLGGGFPIGAMITFGERASSLLEAGQHGTTFGGNPVAAAAGLATLHVIARDGLLEQVRACGDRLNQQIAAIDHPLLEGSRGHGYLLALTLTRPIAAQLHGVCLDAGFIVNPVAPQAIRLAPSLITTSVQLDTFVDQLPELLDRTSELVAQEGKQ